MDIQSTQENLFRNKVKEVIERLGEVKELIFLPLDKSELKKLYDSRISILNRYFDLMRNGHASHCPPPAKLNDPRDLDENYDIVFKTVGKKNSNVTISAQSSKYGNGANVPTLTRGALESIHSQENGCISISIGAAFRFRTHEYMPPFVASNKPRDATLANKEMKKLQAMGFDSIEVEEDGRRKIYWQAGSVVTIATALVRVHHLCIICGDDFPESKGFFCSKKHFKCWNCLVGYVVNAAAPGAIQRSTDAEGNPKCAECDEVYSLQDIAKANAPESLFIAIENMKFHRKMQPIVEKLLEEENKKREAEIARIMAIVNLDERRAEMLKLEIVETILTLKCPSCKAAFIDFTGCFALSCHKCRCGFCAWCLADCGSDAHRHVASCVESTNRGSPYGSFEEFERHHKVRKTRRIVEKLRNESANIRTLVLKMLKKELTDLNIQIPL